MSEFENELNPTQNEKTNIEGEKWEKKYNVARSNLLIVIAFTFINMVLLLANSSRYFLFSATIPYALTDLGMYLCGKYPAEYYGTDYALLDFHGNSLFITLVGISVVIVGVYLLCWFMSKNRKIGWLIAALVLFTLDTLAIFVLYGFSPDLIIDIVFHIWVIYYLITGLIAHSKLKKMTVEGI